jgi:hypothetical protein
LNINFQASDSEQVILQSPTNSTIVELKQQEALLRVHFFDAYRDFEEKAPARRGYTLQKLDALLGLLEEEPVTFNLVALVFLARHRVQSAEAPGLRAALADAYPTIALFSGGQPLFDVDLRVSHTEDDAFVNHGLRWYQERRAMLVLGGGSPLSLREWDLPLVEEGVEYKYDRNNKRALFDGQREWSGAKTRSFVENALDKLAIGAVPLLAPLQAPEMT